MISSQPTPLEEPGRLFRLLVSSVMDYAMLVFDEKGYVITWNEGAQRIKGYSAEEIIGKHFSLFYPEELRNSGHPEFELHSAIENGRYEEEGWRVRKDGSLFWANVIVTPLYENNMLIGFAKVTRDLTERKLAEDQLHKSRQELEILNIELGHARDEAQAASKFKSEFLANMSHEIRTPMNGIIGLSNVLLRTSLAPQQVQYAESIKTAANALLTVINEILDFSKIEAGKIELEIGEFSPVRVVEGACEILAASARNKQLTLMSFIDPRLPDRLRGDGERIRQIILNLASNAIKFSDQGEIVVSAIQESSRDNVLNVRFSVADRGIGLNKEEQAKLFQPFVQADGSINRKYGGTGLGLSISKRLAELMNGSLGVNSEKGEGSTFWLVVPLELVSGQPTITAREELRGVRVLVVDDEPQSREIIHNYVVSWGMRNGIAKSAAQALDMLKRAAEGGDPYNVAIVDLVMPDQNGIDLAKELFQDPALSSVSLVLLTAFDTPGLGAQAIEMGFKSYLTKPIRQSKLLDCLMDIVCGRNGLSQSIKELRRLAPREVAKSYRDELLLVAEDHAINQQVAQLYLDELGFACEVVSNGREAIEAISEKEYDLVLMDCQMPEVDGLTATKIIRDNQKQTGKHVPIIAMTAHAMKGDREKCLAAGMDDYISKPMDPLQLKAILFKWLGSETDSLNEEITRERIPSPSSAPIDLSELSAKYGDENVPRLLNLFLEDAPKQIHKAYKAASAENIEELRQVIHALKGICASVCAHRMRELCVEIENSIRLQHLNRAKAEIAQLEIEFDVLKKVASGKL